MGILHNYISYSGKSFICKIEFGIGEGCSIFDEFKLAQTFRNESLELGIDGLLSALEGDVLFELEFGIVGFDFYLIWVFLCHYYYEVS